MKTAYTTALALAAILLSAPSATAASMGPVECQEVRDANPVQDPGAHLYPVANALFGGAAGACEGADPVVAGAEGTVHDTLEGAKQTCYAWVGNPACFAV